MRMTNRIAILMLSACTATFVGCSEMKDNPRTTGTIAGGESIERHGAALGGFVDRALRPAQKRAEDRVVG